MTTGPHNPMGREYTREEIAAVKRLGMRCDRCGRFAESLSSVWANPPQNGIDREVCDTCCQRTKETR